MTEEAFVSTTEYPLPSLHRIDVFFKGVKKCVAVEVKIIRLHSYPPDYERGIFQVKKYHAILLAMSVAGKLRPAWRRVVSSS